MHFQNTRSRKTKNLLYVNPLEFILLGVSNKEGSNLRAVTITGVLFTHGQMTNPGRLTESLSKGISTERKQAFFTIMTFCLSLRDLQFKSIL